MPPKKRKRDRAKERRSTDFEESVAFVKNWIYDRTAEGCVVRKVVVNDESVRSMGIAAFYFAIEKAETLAKKRAPEPKPVVPRSVKIDLTLKGGPVVREASDDEEEPEEKRYPWGRFIVARVSIFDVLEDNGLYVKNARKQKADKLLRCAVANLIRRKSWYFDNEDCGGALPATCNAYVIEQQLANARLLSSLETVLYGYVLGRLHEKNIGIVNPMVFKQSASEKLKVRVDDSFDPHAEFDKALDAYVARKLNKYEGTAVAKSLASRTKGWNGLSPRAQFAKLYLAIEGRRKRSKKRGKKTDAGREEQEAEEDRADLGRHDIPTEAEKNIRYRVNKKYAEINGSSLLKELTAGPDGKHFSSLLKFLERAKREEERKLDDFYDCLLHALFFAAHHWCAGGPASANYHAYIKPTFEAAGNPRNGRDRTSDDEDDSEDESEDDSEDFSEDEEDVDPNADF